jgi:hypothetical protein
MVSTNFMTNISQERKHLYKDYKDGTSLLNIDQIISSQKIFRINSMKIIINTKTV